MPSPHLRSVELCPTNLRAENLHELFTILHGTFVCSFPWVIQSLIYIRCTRGYLFWVIIQYYFVYLSDCSNCPRFGHWELFQLAQGSLWHTPNTRHRFCWFVCLNFLLCGDTRCSRPFWLFPAPFVEALMSPRTLVPFIGEWMLLETKTWVVGVLIAPRVQLLPSVFSADRTRRCVDISPYTHIYL